MNQLNIPLFENTLSNGNSNKVATQDLPFHDWYRFVLAFPPHLVRHYIKRFGVSNKETLLDPFCGTGTSLVECKKHSVPSIGIEALPMPVLASKVKTNWSIDGEQLENHAMCISERVITRLNKQGIRDDPEFTTSISADSLRTLSHSAQKLLLKDSISPLPLHKTLVLLDEIKNENENPYRKYELLALAKALVTIIGNLKFGPEVGVGRPKYDTSVIQPWISNILAMKKDLISVAHANECKSTIYQADSRDISKVLPKSSVDTVFTSPPYPNEKDYTRTTRLETVILGLANTMSELRGFKQKLVRSNTRSVYKSDEDDKYVKDNPNIQKIANDIERRRIELGKTSGFERLYHRVTKLYFGGMYQHLANLRTVLRPGAWLGYVVGDQASYLRIMIRTGQIIAEIATSVGYHVECIDLFRTRLSTVTGEQLREEVVVLRWPG